MMRNERNSQVSGFVLFWVCGGTALRLKFVRVSGLLQFPDLLHYCS